jgi:DNA-binding transcriptional ArsR family regulator
MSRGGHTDSNDGLGERVGTAGRSERTLSRIFELLASDRRRCALGELRAAAPEAVAVDDLADRLREREPTAADRDRVRIALYHKTLPRLADAGVVDFDRRADVVRYRAHEPVEAILDAVTDRGASGASGRDRPDDL